MLNFSEAKAGITNFKTKLLFQGQFYVLLKMKCRFFDHILNRLPQLYAIPNHRSPVFDQYLFNWESLAITIGKLINNLFQSSGSSRTSVNDIIFLLNFIFEKK
ncbi:hypothetical protein PEDI_39110 [Persicobacter diffluens]|uniref:Uncharacterized protein n=1 Tax=Persicobacter diffluens TaxID=981 RepID=A0AAN4W0C2_9BACT|nr:hypothetical protein PEDI_39110 [Persicobacter diffluens]